VIQDNDCKKINDNKRRRPIPSRIFAQSGLPVMNLNTGDID
jgi:hypothetical protein